MSTQNSGTSVEIHDAMQKTMFGRTMASKQEAEKFFTNNPGEFTLDNVLQAELPVFVRNNLKGKSIVALDFMVTGKRKTISVPNSFLPLNLNDVMSPSDIAGSGSLRGHLRKGSVVLVHPQKAREFLATERGQRELDKYRTRFANTEALQIFQAKPDNGNVSDTMRLLVANFLEAPKEKKQDVLDEIYNNARGFTKTDVTYFQENTVNYPDAQKQVVEMLEIIEQLNSESM